MCLFVNFNHTIEIRDYISIIIKPIIYATTFFKPIYLNDIINKCENNQNQI